MSVEECEEVSLGVLSLKAPPRVHSAFPGRSVSGQHVASAVPLLPRNRIPVISSIDHVFGFLAGKLSNHIL